LNCLVLDYIFPYADDRLTCASSAVIFFISFSSMFPPWSFIRSRRTHFPYLEPPRGFLGVPSEFIHLAITAAPRARPSSINAICSSGESNMPSFFIWLSINLGLHPVMAARPVNPMAVLSVTMFLSLIVFPDQNRFCPHHTLSG